MFSGSRARGTNQVRHTYLSRRALTLISSIQVLSSFPCLTLCSLSSAIVLWNCCLHDLGRYLSCVCLFLTYISHKVDNSFQGGISYKLMCCELKVMRLPDHATYLRARPLRMLGGTGMMLDMQRQVDGDRYYSITPIVLYSINDQSHSDANGPGRGPPVRDMCCVDCRLLSN
jgi:hypothetical protein